MPEDKVDPIRKLWETTEVAAVGDGVNDAPALATAAWACDGRHRLDVALQTVDVALMAGHLAHLPFSSRAVGY